MKDLKKQEFDSRAQREKDEVKAKDADVKQGRGMKVSGKSLKDIPKELRAAFIEAVQAEAGDAYFVKTNIGRFTLPNPMHRMDADVVGGTVQVSTSNDGQSSTAFTLALVGYGYGSRLKAPVQAQVSGQRNRVDLERGDLVEWYVNGRLGLEQGFTLQQEPAGRGQNNKLTFEVEFSGDVSLDLDTQNDSLSIGGKKDNVQFTYGHILAQDAQGYLLPVTLKLSPANSNRNATLSIEIDDSDAAYPITLDPIIQQAKISASDPQANSMYGESVAIHGDTAVIGSYLADLTGATDAGAAYVFVRSGLSWIQQAKLTAYDANTGQYFANSVAIYGDTIVVGADLSDAPGQPLTDDRGYLYVYVRSGSTWSLQQKLGASDALPYDHLGISVAIYGDTIVAGAPNDDHSSLGEVGSAYVFVRSGSTWSQQAKLIASDPGSNDFFGFAVDISGDTAIASVQGKGVYVYVRSGGTWTQQAKLVPSDSITGTGYGYNVAIDGDSVIVGGYTSGGIGAAYVFTRSGTTWSQQAKLTASDGASGDGFANGVEIQGNTALVGAPWADHSGKTDPGAVYVFNRTGANWSQTDKIIASDADNNNRFGYFVALSGMNAVIGAPSHYTLGQPGSAYIFQVSPPSSQNSGAPSGTLSWAGEVQQDASIALRTGEKVETVTDLDVNTPVGPMTFTRTFRQNKRGVYQFMGMGWTHNHAMSLVKTTGTPNRLTIQMENGGELKLSETAPSSNTYLADSGSDAKVVFNTGTSQYTLTGSDKSTYVFDSAGKLLSRGWANGEQWTYTYTSGKLTSIDDGYGRGLRFVYRSNPGQYHDGQLWRVGDHQSSGLSGSPTGRYVEYTFTEQRNNGTVISSPKALLYQVRDLLGNTWKHEYYGQNAGQNVAAQLDFLLETVSPQIDTDGNGTTDSAITLEKLTYTTSGSTVTNITRELGSNSISTSYAFQPSGQNLTNETTAGLTSVHRFSNGVYEGTEDPAKNYVAQFLNFQYRPEAIQDAKGNRSKMEWTADGKLLTKVTDALGNVTTYTYNTSGNSADTLSYSIDPLGRKTQFTYGDAAQPRLPTRIEIFDKDGGTKVYQQEWTYDAKGRVLTEKLINPADTSKTLRQITRTYYMSAGNGYGLLQAVTTVDLTNPGNNLTTTYTYDGIGRVTKVQQSSLFGACKASFALYNAANRVVASICNYENAGAEPTTVPAAVALFNAATPEKNRVTTYEYDALGRQTKMTTDAGAAYAQVMLTIYDSLGRVKRFIRNYKADLTISDPFVRRMDDFRHGANNDQNLVEDIAYNARGGVRSRTDVMGRVTLYGYDDADRLVRTVVNASQPTYLNDFVTNGDPSLARYAQMVALDAPDVDIISTLEYDAAGNVVKATDAVGNVMLTAYDALNRAVKSIRNASQPLYDRRIDPALLDYIASTAGDQDIVQVVEYDGVGRVRRTQDTFGEWTLYSYDTMDRPIRTVRNASRPTYNTAADPLLTNYVESTAVDQDIMTQIAYDPAGRMMYSGDEQGRRDWVAYDGRERIIKRIDNASGGASDDGINDPRSTKYGLNDAFADRDLIAYIEYDSDGRAWRTRDALGNWTLYGYDTVNRPVKVVRNASNPNYAAAQDPTLAKYVPGVMAADDQDIVTQTRYDAQGRVAATVNPLKRETRFTYDALGRTIKTVVNFHKGIFDAAFPDRDLTSTTRYREDGRVLIAKDVRGTETRFGYDRLGRTLTVTQAALTALATTSYTCYDKGGRVLRTIQNWKPLTSSPSPDTRDGQGNWLFAPANGSNNDQNLITRFTLDKAGRAATVVNAVGNSASMSYEKDGKIASMTDPIGVVTVMRYDRARRGTITVRNYVTFANSGDPAKWSWNAGSGSWKAADGTTSVQFGANNDQNILTQVEYDKSGRRIAMRDPRGKRTTYAYDALDRRTRLTDPRGSTWTTAYTPLRDGTMQLLTTDPLNNVAQTDVNRLGQVASVQYLNESPKNTPDVFFSYDRLGNRLSMVEKNGATTVRRTEFGYDRANRLARAAFDSNGDGTVDETVQYSYEAGGQRTKLTLPDGKTVSYAYDARGRLTSLTDWASQSASYSYDGASRLASRTANGITTTQAYDAASRLTLLEHKAGATTLGCFAYTLNARGDRTQAAETLARAGGGQDEHTQVYGYDGARRVTSAIRYPGMATSGTPQRSDTYSYDVASNRLSQAVALNGGAATTTNYTYDDANRLSNAGFAYDNAGRMTSDGTNTYTWDRGNRLRTVGSTSYTYDGAGRRIRQTVSGVTTNYLLDVSMGLWETLVETTGANATRYVHDPRRLLAQQRPDASWQWAMNDGLGSVRGMLNSSQSPQDSRLYAPYGEATQLSGTSQSGYGFTGEPTDGNGLVYLRARYYAPGIGVFASVDPLETANRYAYVGGNVVNATDPSGLVATVRPRMIDVDEARAVVPGTRLPTGSNTSHGNNTATAVRSQNTTNPGSNLIGVVAGLTNFLHNIGEAIKPITPVLSNAVASVQQAVLQVGFGVTLTSQQANTTNVTPANFSNGSSSRNVNDLWTADQVNTLFQTVARTAQTYGNLVPNAPEGRSAPPNPFLLFQQINGPMEMRLQSTQIMQVNFDGTQCANAAAGKPNYAGEAGTDIFGLTCPQRGGGSIIHLAAGTNGSLGAFGSQYYPPSGDGRLSFNAEFLIAHEMAHAADFYSDSGNWPSPESRLRDRYVSISPNSDTQSGMPGTRATSVGNNASENFADAVANLVTGGFSLDPSLGQTTTEDQAQRQDIIESVLRAAILDNGFGY